MIEADMNLARREKILRDVGESPVLPERADV